MESRAAAAKTAPADADGTTELSPKKPSSDSIAFALSLSGLTTWRACTAALTAIAIPSRTLESFLASGSLGFSVQASQTLSIFFFDAANTLLSFENPERW